MTETQDWYIGHFASRLPENGEKAAIAPSAFGSFQPMIDMIPDGHVLVVDFQYPQPERNEHLLIARTGTDDAGNPSIYALVCGEKPSLSIMADRVVRRDAPLSWGAPYVVETIADSLIAHKINEVANSPYGDLYVPPKIGVRVVDLANQHETSLQPEQTPLPAILADIEAVHDRNGLGFQRWRHRAGQRADVCAFAPSATPFGRAL